MSTVLPPSTSQEPVYPAVPTGVLRCCKRKIHLALKQRPHTTAAGPSAEQPPITPAAGPSASWPGHSGPNSGTRVPVSGDRLLRAHPRGVLAQWRAATQGVGSCTQLLPLPCRSAPPWTSSWTSSEMWLSVQPLSRRRAAADAPGPFGRGGIRTRTRVTPQGVLSPQRLPFRHSPEVSWLRSSERPHSPGSRILPRAVFR